MLLFHDHIHDGKEFLCNADYYKHKQQTWYDKENEFEDDDIKYFHRPYLERITNPNHLLQAWCVTMERLQSMHEHMIRETTIGRDIRAFFT